MRITRVTTNNFRCHKQLSVDLEEYHVLVGENGSGKTAVLEAINLATSSHFGSSRISEQDFNSDDSGPIQIQVYFDSYHVNKVPDGYTHQLLPSNCVQITAKRREAASPGKALSDPFVVTHTSIPVLYSSKSEIDAAKLPQGISANDLPNSVQQTVEGYLVRRKSGSDMKLRDDTISFGNDLSGFPNVFYFDRFREKEAKIGFGSLLTKVCKDLNWRYRKGWSQDATLNAWNEYYSSVIDVVEEKKKREIIAPLRKRLTSLIGDDFANLELSLLSLEEPFSKGFLSVRSRLNQIDLTGIGSGISMIVAYCLLDQISQLSKERVIFLVDEPEMHLHPQLQQKLSAQFCESSNQIVITSHSANFVDLSKWHGITRFDSKARTFPTQGILDCQVENTAIRGHLDEIPRWHQHETVYLESDSDLLFARKVLLVEGPAEKYGIPRLATLATLPLKDVTIVACNGKTKIPYYSLLCVAYDVPFHILYDLDGKGCADTENARVVEFASGNPVHYFDKSFETLLGLSGEDRHKGSETLLKIDSIQKKEDIPKEIVNALKVISKWSRAHANQPIESEVVS